MMNRFIVRGRIFDWYIESHIYSFLSNSFSLESTKDFKVWKFVVFATQEKPKMIRMGVFLCKVDYDFLSSSGTEPPEELEALAASGQSPVLCFRDRCSESPFWYLVPRKGTEFETFELLLEKLL